MIAAALHALADYIEDHAFSTTWDAHHNPSDEQRAVKADKVKVVARELRALAEAAGTRQVRYGEYGALRDRLYAFGFPLTSKLAQDVVTALREAEGPEKPRERGWLRWQGGA